MCVVLFRLFRFDVLVVLFGFIVSFVWFLIDLKYVSEVLSMVECVVGGGVLIYDYVALFFVFLVYVIFFFVILCDVLFVVGDLYLLGVVILFFSVMFFLLMNCGLYFYLFFDLSFVVMMFFVFLWGVKPERLRAIIFFIIFGVFSSFPVFFFLVYFSSLLKFVFSFAVVNSGGLAGVDDVLLGSLFFFWVVGFIVKFPVFGFHF